MNEHLDVTPEQQTARLVRVSEQMLAAAEAADWQRLIELEHSREQLMSALGPIGQESQDFSIKLLEQMQQLLEMNGKILDMVQAGMSGARRELSRISAGKRAVNAYNGTY